MHWTWEDVQRLPVEIYDVLLDELAGPAGAPTDPEDAEDLDE